MGHTLMEEWMSLVIGLVISGSTGRGFPETSGQASVGR
jgi:hypothetical protein